MFVKICGVTNEEDALVAVGMGADAIGFNFVPGSPRQISPRLARDIIRRLPGGIVTVGVFRNELPERVVQIMDGAGLRLAQLHGNETAADSRWVAERVPGLIKAFVAGDPNVERVRDYGASVLMLDSSEPGSGRVFDWRQLEGRDRGMRLLLAGGLRASNVAQAIEIVRPWGVDVASGVESESGRKDVLAMREFIAKAKDAGALYEDAEEPEAPGPEAPYDWRDD
ncbi:phosphoribosylanthranilate isomerase [Candidatus Poriferisodalis sp.]|uniref:phosphoribosylanthranilate isomerase n=1 Tax=Candidatus Poriferisodalis sp. TaxID=3101277 RepID=UPI003B51A7C3